MPIWRNIVTQQHQLGHLSHIRDMVQEMYNKVQADSRVPQLEKDLKEARLKWVNLTRECAALTAKVKKVPRLEAEVDELKHTISKLRSVQQAEVEGLCTAHQIEVERLCGLHSTEIENKDYFCKVEKVRVLSEL